MLDEADESGEEEDQEKKPPEEEKEVPAAGEEDTDPAGRGLGLEEGVFVPPRDDDMKD